MTNIKQIAKLAGVSVTTVSRVLNDHPYVNEAKRSAVKEAIEQLHYTRNSNAVHLAKGKTFLIGVITPYTNHPYFGAIIEGISKQANAAGYHLVIFHTNYQRHKEIQALDMLRTKQLDSIIICSRVVEMKILRAYKGYGPIILCEDTMQTEFPSVCIDHYAAVTCAFDHLIKNNYSKIGLVLGRMIGRNSHQRLKAYHESVEKYQLDARKEWLIDGIYNMTDGGKVFHRWDELVEKPDALIISNDEAAAGFILQAKQSGKDVPGNLGIIGFNNDGVAEMLGITTVSLPLEQIGKTAFDLSQLEKEPAQIKLEFRLIKRNTV